MVAKPTCKDLNGLSMQVDFNPGLTVPFLPSSHAVWVLVQVRYSSWTPESQTDRCVGSSNWQIVLIPGFDSAVLWKYASFRCSDSKSCWFGAEFTFFYQKICGHNVENIKLVWNPAEVYIFFKQFLIIAVKRSKKTVFTKNTTLIPLWRFSWFITENYWEIPGRLHWQPLMV